ncbi:MULTISPECIES: hypothetical protein [unclassified Pseudomonas]|uniref:hypothetical protein n=1 Tax=unclassified Pseudomonas TaxID=196821 RepID=UPI002AC8B92A|nr:MULTISPECIES: hypothetical protein [unclassified Pseudomonas]MEB0047774.1 hypothetical protein [Pseudomonas sp. Dout3]MEB0098265.1 hypothetical protein [Pseudomonas sp. DC1.2]WPX59222.1 hypothetical protein RHM68_00750 [Pseudomonas sp. DC1.2]
MQPASVRGAPDPVGHFEGAGLETHVNQDGNGCLGPQVCRLAEVDAASGADGALTGEINPAQAAWGGKSQAFQA